MVKIEDVISLGISADTSSAARELRRLNNILRSVKDPTDQLARTQALLNESMRLGEINYQTFADGLAKATSQARKQIDTVGKLRSEYDRLAQATKKAKDEANRKAGLEKQELEKVAKAKKQAELDQVTEGRAALAVRGEKYKRDKAARLKQEAAAEKAIADAARAAFEDDLADEQRALKLRAAQKKLIDDGIAKAAKHAADEENRIRDQARRDFIDDLEAEKRILEMRAAQKKLIDDAIAKRDKDAEDDAERQRRLAAQSRAGLSSQRGAAFSEADRLNTQQNPNEFYRRGVASLDALRQNGLSNEAYDAQMQDLVDRTNAMDRELQNASRSQEQYNAAQQRGVEYMRQFDNHHQALNRRLAEARTLFSQGSLSAQEYERAVGLINRRASLTHQALTAMRGAILTVVGPLTALYVGFSSLSKSIQLSAQLEQSTAKLKVFLGSAYEAERTLSNLRALSVQGVGFNASTKAATTMLQFGVAQKDLLPSLEALAEITAGDNERLENLALAFSQSAAAGRLMGQELLQMVNAGFNPLKIISEQTGKSLADLKDEMSKGLIPFELVKKAFIDATSAGGKFDGLLEEIAGTSSGKLSKLVAKLQELGTAFGQAITPETNSILDSLNASLAETAQLLDQIAKGRKSSDKENEFNNAGILEDYNIRQDSIAAREALGKGDAEEAVKRLDRIKNRNLTPGIIGGLSGLSKDEIDGIEQLREAMEDLEKIRERAKRGVALSPAEQAYLDFLEREERTLKKVDDAKQVRLQSRYREQLEAAGKLKGDAKTKAEMEAFVSYGNAVGQGFLSDEEVKRLDAYIERLARLKTEADRLNASKERIAEATDKPLEKLRDKVDDLRFGKNASTGESNVQFYKEIAEMLSPEDRQTVEKIIAESSSTGDIWKGIRGADIDPKDLEDAVTRANEMLKLREKLKKLTDDEDKKDKTTKDAEAVQKKSQEEIKALESKLKYQRDLLTMTKEEARVKQLMREGPIGEKEAKAQAKAERELKVAENKAQLQGKATQTNRAIDPYNGFVDEMAQLELQKKQGLLDPGVYEKRRKQLMDENIKAEQVGAAPNISKGSQEAFKALSGQSVDKINQQLNEQKRQTVLLGKTPEILKRTNELLEELNDNKPAKLGP